MFLESLKKLKPLQHVLAVQDRKAAFMRQAFETDGSSDAVSARENLLKVRVLAFVLERLLTSMSISRKCHNWLEDLSPV